MEYKGGFEDGKLAGEGILSYTNGITFSGQLKDGKPYNGTMTMPGGAKYKGQVRARTSSNGISFFEVWQCRMDFKDGTWYDGEWHYNFYRGNGTIMLEDGSIYSGSFLHYPRGDATAFKNWVRSNLVLQNNPKIEQNKEQKQSLVSQSKEQCIDIGFKPETQKYADCVLRVTELNEGGISGIADEDNLKQRELLELQIQREKQLQKAQKIEALKDILRGLGGNTNRSSTTTLDVSCYQDCLWKNRADGLCRKECSY